MLPIWYGGLKGCVPTMRNRSRNLANALANSANRRLNYDETIRSRRWHSYAAAFLLAYILCVGQAGAQQPKTDSQSLAKAAQNPIADLISVPFQNNTNFNYGPRERTQNILNIQPVIPITLSPDWNLITRTIIPIVHQPSLAKGDSSTTGLGDINPSAFFATSIAKDLLVGFGPTVTLATSTDSDLGSRRYSAG